jgi:hypothetical protein
VHNAHYYNYNEAVYRNKTNVLFYDCGLLEDIDFGIRPYKGIILTPDFNIVDYMKLVYCRIWGLNQPIQYIDWYLADFWNLFSQKKGNYSNSIGRGLEFETYHAI